MSPQLSQAARPAKLTTPLGEDVLVLRRFDVVEMLSDLYEIRIEALSQEEGIDFDKLLGRHCHVELQIEEDLAEGRRKEKTRHFCGVLTQAQWLGVHLDLDVYRLVLRPWPWLLDQTARSKIFHNKTVDKIIETVLRERNFGDLRLDLKGYPTLEYCVQYRETDFAFVSRLMAEYGICYYFEHEAGSHRLVLADQPSAHRPVPETETLPYLPHGGHARRDVEHISHWLSERRFQTGKVALRDYNYDTPDADMNADKQASEKYEHSHLEVYDYPGRYKVKGDGVTLAEMRLDALQARDHRRLVTGHAATLYPGGLTTIERHPDKAENRQYLVVQASHSFTDLYEYRTGGSGTGSGETEYSGHYEFQPADRPFRPLHAPRKPTIHGPQTATVVGEEGEEIDVEDAGRTLVNGTVFNGRNKMPFGTKAKKQINGIKSNSTTGGGGFNQFVFDDTKRSEKMEVRAEKDLNELVRDTATTDIGEAFTGHKGKAARKVTIKKGDDELKVSAGHQSVDVKETIHIKAGQKITLEVGGSTIVMDGSSITLKSVNIMIDASGELTAKGTMTTLKGAASTVIQGGVVKIN